MTEKIKNTGIILLCLSSIIITGINRGYTANTMEMMVLVDDSGSMKKNDPHNLRLYTLYYFGELLQGKDIKLRLIKFGGDSEEVFAGNLKSGLDREEFKKAIDKFRSSDKYTDYTIALKKAYKILKSSDTKEKMVILITDGKIDPDPAKYRGEPNADEISKKELTDKIVPTLKKDKIKLNVIGLSQNIPKELLKKISRETGGNFYIVNTSKSIDKGFRNLITTIINDVGEVYAKVKKEEIKISKEAIEEKVKELKKEVAKKPKKVRKKIDLTGKNYAEVVYVKGTVKVKRANRKIERVKVGTKLYSGDLLKSYGSSRATIMLPTKVTFQIKGNTIIKLSKFLPGKKENKSNLGLLYGIAKIKVGKLLKKRNRLKVVTPTAVIGVRGTYFEASATEDKTTVKVYTGSVTVKDKENKGAEQVVKAGYSCEVSKGDSATEPEPITGETENPEDDTSAPVITVIQPAGSKATTSTPEYTIIFTVTDDNLDKVYVNGEEIGGVASGQTVAYMVEVNGVLTVTIRAVDINGNESSVTRQIILSPPLPPER